MTSASEAAVDGPARKRDSWSLKHLVEDVTGRPIEELQEPGKPWHPYLQAKMASHRASAAPSVPSPVDDAEDHERTVEAATLCHLHVRATIEQQRIALRSYRDWAD